LNSVIERFDQEIQFYISFVDYAAIFRAEGLEFCLPVVSDCDKETYADEVFDPALAFKLIGQGMQTIQNSFHLEGPERIIVVSGPNQGGKTTFARTFGQLHYLASLGCPVPGSNVRLFLFDRLFTHFEKVEKIENLHGKLQDDLLRIHSRLAQASPNSIVIMNEIFSSTTLQDAIFLGERVMGELIKLDLIGVCVTFIDEFASLGEKVVSMASTVIPENPAERTFKIIRKPADGLAYAIAIAEKYGLTYASLKERLVL
jgi:DNA mismatch repair ATPase MutS